MITPWVSERWRCRSKTFAKVQVMDSPPLSPTEAVREVRLTVLGVPPASPTHDSESSRQFNGRFTSVKV
jgi:hypothetical protein